MRKTILLAVVSFLAAVSLFIGAVVWTVNNVEVYWDHESVSLRILNHEWMFDAYCDCKEAGGH